MQLPVYVPSPEEQQDPKLYASNVRKYMVSDIFFMLEFCVFTCEGNTVGFSAQHGALLWGRRCDAVTVRTDVPAANCACHFLGIA